MGNPGRCPGLDYDCPFGARNRRGKLASTWTSTSLACPHGERHAAHDATDNRCKTEILRPRLADNFAHGGCIVSLHAAAQREREQLLSERSDENLRAREQTLLHTGHAFELAALGQIGR